MPNCVRRKSRIFTYTTCACIAGISSSSDGV